MENLQKTEEDILHLEEYYIRLGEEAPEWVNELRNYYNLMLWKKKYGEVSFVEVKGITFHFRLLKRGEYDLLKKLNDDPLKLDEKVAQLCVLDPVIEDGWEDELYAGVTATLSRVILEESLIIPKPEDTSSFIEELVNKKYNEINNSFEKQMPIIITKAFPSYKIEEIMDWPLTRQVDMYSRAIWLLNEIEIIPYNISFKEDGE